MCNSFFVADELQNKLLSKRELTRERQFYYLNYYLIIVPKFTSKKKRHKMHDTYFVEERSGVIGIGPLTNSPDLYYRRQRGTNWGSLTSWIHLIICLLAIPLIIWNLFLLTDTIKSYTTFTVNPTGDTVQYSAAHPLALMVIISAILMNL